MWSKIWGLIEVVRALISLWREYVDAREVKEAKDRLEKSLERDKAIADLKKAKSEEEFWDAQERLVRADSRRP